RAHPAAMMRARAAAHRPMPTIFERIVAGELPCHRVWEDARHLAFLDREPRVEGHTLVVPKRHTDYLFDLSDADTTALWLAAKEVAHKLKRVLGCERVCVYVIGWEVRHVHVHLLPTNSIAEAPMPPVDPRAKAVLAETAARLAP
ncbi:MAG TPA: HIT family protein, partial [Planctomycetota bacterium]|nr:HIT family protein [Planctomycetota bacterium]